MAIENLSYVFLKLYKNIPNHKVPNINKMHNMLISRWQTKSSSDNVTLAIVKLSLFKNNPSLVLLSQTAEW